ncbi:MBL fold metallo-hydrolase [Luteolibacter arcticus]|uniref:MBL fold metallo-hydrolase n=1 Tax=Luteolibacter arcticus TaxID=1581411 RepID=A0ABT3GSR2_9BACT|nr:MBL fold metallo-hydrolase [Luteolibacter arcticus]MCW1926552.1 MBL fold metallo-hydrolase [Luteolibacter arcticus]
MEFFFLDVGPEEYGDCILCRKDGELILIDGGHPRDWESRQDGARPALQDQMAKALETEPPFHLKLLVVTHAHKDHIGCLPRLVKDEILTAEWALVADEKYGWGRHRDTDGARDGDDLPEGVRAVLAALREDTVPDLSDPAAVARFLADAVLQEDEYGEMLEKLKDDGTRMVRYGRSRTTELLEAFSHWELAILGPSKGHLVACADAVHKSLSDAAAAIRGRVEVAGFTDAEASRVDLYRWLVSQEPLADGVSLMDASKSRPGHALNNQSIILSFGGAGERVLLAGDMQFIKPGMRAINEDMAVLREKVKNHGKYVLIKTCHHTSDNGVDLPWLRDMGWDALVIHSGGEKDDHPHAGRLRELSDRAAEVPDKWLRNDRNGMITCVVANGEVTAHGERGYYDDFTPNLDHDAAAAPAVVNRPETEAPVRVVIPQGPSPGPGTVAGGGMGLRRPDPPPGATGFVEVNVKVPHQKTRVTVTIDVDPEADTEASKTEAAVTGQPRDFKQPPDQPVETMKLGGGRSFPRLLAVTDRARLAANVGQEAADRAIRMLQGAGLDVLGELPSTGSGSLPAREVVRQVLAEAAATGADYVGVLLVGGHDVVPHVVVDALPKELRDHFKANPLPLSQQDQDDFIVWSDHPYGDVDGAGANEVPVSRVPDGHSADLLLAALSAPERPAPAAGTFGLRNLNRPFAEGVFKKVGEGTCLTSATTGPGSVPVESVDAGRIYLMLHGAFEDASVFWGEESEEDDSQIPAFDLRCLPERCAGAVVFTGCCWGALTLDRPAAWSALPGPAKVRSSEDSLALAFLRRGARAYIGCTGVHYSPDAEPYGFLGGPMHSAFWEAMNEARMWPALALHQARLLYLNGLPHGKTELSFQAAEYKTFHQFTCLGLGW